MTEAADLSEMSISFS